MAETDTPKLQADTPNTAAGDQSKTAGGDQSKTAAENQSETAAGEKSLADGSAPEPHSELERLKIDLERYKSKLDFWKYIVVSGFAAAAVAAIPPGFQYATAKLEEAKSAAQLNAVLRTQEADRNAKQEAFRQDYVKLFLYKAVDQDIELRLRFAEYFASVSPDPIRSGWVFSIAAQSLPAKA